MNDGIDGVEYRHRKYNKLKLNNSNIFLKWILSSSMIFNKINLICMNNLSIYKKFINFLLASTIHKNSCSRKLKTVSKLRNK